MSETFNPFKHFDAATFLWVAAKAYKDEAAGAPNPPELDELIASLQAYLSKHEPRINLASAPKIIAGSIRNNLFLETIEQWGNKTQ